MPRASPTQRLGLAWRELEEWPHWTTPRIRAIEEFEGRWTAVSVVDVSDSLVRLAGDLAERHGLRGFDAIHLASALVVQREGGQPVSFSARDDRLMEAAADEGFAPLGNA